jgi:lysophospholipase L1-like esterase
MAARARGATRPVTAASRPPGDAPRPAGAARLALLAPLLLAQGLRVRRVVPKLPEAAGPRSGEHRPGHRGAAGSAPVRVLIAGDSSAAGVGARTQDEALAGRLSAAMAAGTSRAVRWQLVARTGLDARGLLSTLAASSIDDFDVAIVVVGVNDVTGLVGVSRWLRRLDRIRALLRDARPGALVVVSGLPPMHRFPALPQPLRSVLGGRARQFDDALARWASSAPRTVHVPIPDLDGPGLSASDGFHPGPAAYALWADELARAIAAELAARPDR